MSTIADSIRSEASIADRPGSLARLTAIADQVEALESEVRAAKVLSDGLSRWIDQNGDDLSIPALLSMSTMFDAAIAS